MSSFVQFLGPSTANIETGIVVEVSGRKQYKVRIRGRDFALQSAMNEPLVIGDRVIINKTQYNRYIVGTTKRVQSETETEEVVVDG